MVYTIILQRSTFKYIIHNKFNLRASSLNYHAIKTSIQYFKNGKFQPFLNSKN